MMDDLQKGIIETIGELEYRVAVLEKHVTTLVAACIEAGVLVPTKRYRPESEIVVPGAGSETEIEEKP